jgi:hypothetical protein
VNDESHQIKAEQHRVEIYRRMLPEQRLAQAVRMNHSMRSLMEAGLRAQKPDWTELQYRREIARRTLHARTG